MGTVLHIGPWDTLSISDGIARHWHWRMQPLGHVRETNREPTKITDKGLCLRISPQLAHKYDKSFTAALTCASDRRTSFPPKVFNVSKFADSLSTTFNREFSPLPKRPCFWKYRRSSPARKKVQAASEMPFAGFARISSLLALSVSENSSNESMSMPFLVHRPSFVSQGRWQPDIKLSLYETDFTLSQSSATFVADFCSFLTPYGIVSNRRTWKNRSVILPNNSKKLVLWA